MNLKKLLYQKGIKQVDLVRELKIDPSRVSLQINGIRNLPEKHQKKLASILQITLEKLRALSETEASHE